MYDIFKNAEFVYSWLGPGSEVTDVAMNFFSDWGPRALKVGVMEKLWLMDTPMDRSDNQRLDIYLNLTYVRHYFLPEPVFEKGSTVEDSSSTNDEWYEMAKFIYDLLHVEGLRGTRGKSVLSDLETGITHLLTNEYRHRIWIFQEVALAREVLLMCGGKSTPISYFEAVLEALWKFCGGNPWFFKDIPLRRGFCERFPPYLYPNKAIRIRQLLCRRMEVSLGIILVAFSNQTGCPWYRATDPRDIIYGILGLLSHDDRRPFGHVDYRNMTWIDLFTQATRSLIEASLTSCHKDLLYTIGHCLPRSRGQPTELPSWVTDWRDVGVRGLPQSLQAVSGVVLNASKSRIVGIGRSYHINFGPGNPSAIPSAIQLPGYRVDSVNDVMEHDHQAQNVLEKDRASDWLERIRDFTKLPESSDIWNLEGEDYVWRAVMNCHNDIFLGEWLKDPSCKAHTDAACFIRRLVRQDYPDPQTLPDFLVGCIQVSREFRALTNIRTSKHMNDASRTKFSSLNDDASRDATIIVDG